MNRVVSGALGRMEAGDLGGGTGATARLRVMEGGDAARTDDELLQAFRDGRASAFAELVRRHQRVVRAVVRRYAERPDDVLDLAQRAFVRALEAARRTPLLRIGARPPFQALVLRIAVNLGKNHARDAARWQRAPVEALEAVEVAATGSERLERGERLRQVRRAVERLPRRQRDVLTLRIDAELPFAEIARVLGITENNAKVHYHHATRRLAALVAQAGGEEP
jgi:RNA polymerase sigma-70 factor, ECF subfamily